MNKELVHSAEIRWFLGDVEQWDKLLRWFRLENQLPLEKEDKYEPKAEDDPFVKLEKPRTDSYLLFKDSDSVGFKQRGGKLEIKAMVTPPRPYAYKAIKGRMDQWVKWSFSPSETIGKQLAKELDDSGTWFSITKNRYQQKYSFVSGSPVLISPDQWPPIGCNIELTRISHPSDKEITTFGFEAFGPSSQVVAVLDAVVQCFFDQRNEPPVPLDGSNAFSYPAWLAFQP